MRTSGHGNEALTILIPAGLTMVIVILFGGPDNAIAAFESIVQELARAATWLLRAWF